MLGDKPDLAIAALSYTDSQELGTTLGWWVITYRADHQPIGKIDVSRKFWLCRPRQTVSVTMVVGGEQAGLTLPWCLDSLTDLADEIVVIDGGMTAQARDSLSRYADGKFFPVVTVKGPNPVKEGFEAARNKGLSRCTGDWVFWIDSDERLINPRVMQKYLRENWFHGYGIRQHHFACDTTFEPDMPIRLFRRRPLHGKTMKFYGAIHEHPEMELNSGPGPMIVISDAHLAHVGYLIEGTRLRRFTRNYPLLKLDQQRYPERLLQKHFIMRDTMIMVNEALRINGGKVDEEISAKCHEVIDLFRKHFMGKKTFTNADSLTYYSDALKVLGEGFDAAFQIETDKENAVINGTHHYRFANQEDFLTELTARARDKTAAFNSQWW
jgi:glycosyltransferase involved in cell wall biosynthesis